MKVTVKVILNKCFGGFSVSPEFMKALYLKYGDDPTLFESRGVKTREEFLKHRSIDTHFTDGHCMDLIIPKWESVIYDAVLNEEFYVNDDTLRYHQGAIELFEQLGSEVCSGQCAELAVDTCEIELSIESFDGRETLECNMYNWGGW